MISNEAKNKILDNPFNPDMIDLFIDQSEDNRYLGIQKINYVRSFNDFANDKMDEQMKILIPKEGRWHFEFFHSSINVLHHTDKIEGNNGGLGCIIPLRWDGQNPATIMYNYWEYDKRIMYAGDNRCVYSETNEIVDLDLSTLKEELVFEWDPHKIFVFDVYQLHSARKFENAWKEFLIGFLV